MQQKYLEGIPGFFDDYIQALVPDSLRLEKKDHQYLIDNIPVKPRPIIDGRFLLQIEEIYSRSYSPGSETDEISEIISRLRNGSANGYYIMHNKRLLENNQLELHLFLIPHPE